MEQVIYYTDEQDKANKIALARANGYIVIKDYPNLRMLLVRKSTTPPRGYTV